mmetsp:Transcript_27552/g.39111  ORF Transcript_27552/g.39111 Transcript_27552/m.39111 type:complete len:282 (-) Transcript_27552:120-965(-)
MNLKLNNTKNTKMDFYVDELGHVQWTYKLAEGVCTDSMALVTARQYGITPKIIQRAEELKRAIRDKAILVEQLLQGNSASQSNLDSFVNDSFQAEEAIEVTPRISTKSTKSKVHVRYDLHIDVVPVMQEHCFSEPASRSVSEESDDEEAEELITRDVVVVEPGYNPPVSFEGHNCVYVLHVSNTDNDAPDVLYVGETAGIMQRLKRHRQKLNRNTVEYSGSPNRKTPSKLSAAVVKVANKSQARLIETALIRRFKSLGFLLLGDADQAHQLFGSGVDTILT